MLFHKKGSSNKDLFLVTTAFLLCKVTMYNLIENFVWILHGSTTSLKTDSDIKHFKIL